jgi:hypothetical protein
MHPFRKIRAAWHTFISTFTELAAALRQQTSAIEQATSTAERRHQELLAAVAAVEIHAKYTAASERSKLQRAGHKHEL